MSLHDDWQALYADEKALDKRQAIIRKESKRLDARRRELRQRQNVAEGRKPNQLVFKGAKV